MLQVETDVHKNTGRRRDRSFQMHAQVKLHYVTNLRYTSESSPLVKEIRLRDNPVG